MMSLQLKQWSRLKASCIRPTLWPEDTGIQISVYRMFNIYFLHESILCAIMLLPLRFIAVTRPLQYAKHRFSKRVHVTLALTWIVSAAVSSPIVLGWNYTERRRSTPNICTFYNAEFLIYSSMASFYIPCIAMILLYCKTLRVILNRAAARRTQRRRNQGTITTAGAAVPLATIQAEVVPSSKNVSRASTGQKLHRKNINAQSAPAHLPAHRFVANVDLLTPSAEEFDYERGHFRSWLFHSAARRIILRVFPGRRRWRTQHNAGNCMGSTGATFQLTLLDQCRQEPTGETTTTRLLKSEAEETAANVIDASESEIVPLTGRANYLTTTDFTESEQWETDVVTDVDNEAPRSGGCSNRVLAKCHATVVKTDARGLLAAPDQRPSKLKGLQSNFEPALSQCRHLVVPTQAKETVQKAEMSDGKLRIQHAASSSGREKHCGSRERKATKTLAIVLGNIDEYNIYILTRNARTLCIIM